MGVTPHAFCEGRRSGPEAGVEGAFVELLAPQAHLAAEDEVLVQAVLLPGPVVVDGLPGFVGVAGGVAGFPPTTKATVKVPGKEEKNISSRKLCVQTGSYVDRAKKTLNSKSEFERTRQWMKCKEAFLNQSSVSCLKDRAAGRSQTCFSHSELPNSFWVHPIHIAKDFLFCSKCLKELRCPIYIGTGF